MTGPDLLASLRERILALPLSSEVWVACSGGADSVALAQIAVPPLRASGRRVGLVHLDHCLRGRSSRDDARFVSALGETLGVPVLRRARRPSEALSREVGAQAAARQARWELFTSVPGDLLLAHHLDDQLETLQIQQVGGRTVRPGIPRRRGRLHRPLLHLPRAELRALAAQHGWTHREDPSNQDLRYLRSRLRAAARSSDRSEWAGEGREALNARERQTYVDRAAVRAQSRVCLRLGPAPQLARGPWSRLEDAIALTLLAQITPPPLPGGRSPSRAARRGLLTLARQDLGGEERSSELGAGWTARVRGELISLFASSEPPALPRVAWAEIPLPTAARLCRHPEAGRRFAVLDAEVPTALRVCPVGRGRRMVPFGGGGRRLLNDLLAEARIPPALRARWPLVEADDGTPVWLPHARASAFRPLAPDSTRAIVLYTVAPRAQGARTLEWSP